MFLLCVPLKTYAEEHILIVTEEWPPFNYTVNGEITGLSYEVVNHLLQQLDKPYKIEMLPNMRSMKTIANQPKTMMFSMFRTPEREHQFHWIGPIANGAVYFYKRKGADISIRNLSELKQSKLSVCSRSQGSIVRLLVKQGITNLESFATNGAEVYKMLLAGRCDLAISETEFGAHFLLKKLGYSLEDVLERIPFPFYQADLYLAGSKDIPDQEIQQWQTALDQMKSNGTYADILQNYR